MKLKRYIQFIKESLKENIEEGNLWKLNEDQIRDYFIDFEDAGYLLTVEFGFVQKVTKHYYNKTSEEKEVYDEKVLAGENVRPAYWIKIEKSSSVNNEDITSSLKFVYSIISEEANADIELFDADSDVNINTTLVKGGIFINVYPEDDMSGEEAESYLALFVKQKDSVTITPKDLVNFYGWNAEVEKEEQLWAEIDLEDLSDYIISSRSDYKDSLVKGQEHMWDYYDISNYYPEVTSLFQYDLNKENEILTVKSIIKEAGGLEQTINHIGDECDNDIYEKVKEMSEEELIDYLLKERFYDTIKQLTGLNYTNSEIFQEVRDTVANWEMSAHCDDNYDEIISSFDSIVSDELGQYEKVEKEITKFYTSKDAEGNQTKREYKDNVTYYQFPYSNDWIKDIDSDYLYNKDLDDLFRDWVREQSIDRNLNPRISDYGDVDKVKMNADIKSFLTKYLNN
jgi:hypothetical protein